MPSASPWTPFLARNLRAIVAMLTRSSFARCAIIGAARSSPIMCSAAAAFCTARSLVLSSASISGSTATAPSWLSTLIAWICPSTSSGLPSFSSSAGTANSPWSAISLFTASWRAA